MQGVFEEGGLGASLGLRQGRRLLRSSATVKVMHTHHLPMTILQGPALCTAIFASPLPPHLSPRSDTLQISLHIFSEIHEGSGLASGSSPMATPPVRRKRSSAGSMRWRSMSSLEASRKAKRSLSFSNRDLGGEGGWGHRGGRGVMSMEEP